MNQLPLPIDLSQSQRWFHGRHSFRPSAEPINPDLYEVLPSEYSVAREFVKRHHYSGTSVYQVKQYGLFERHRLWKPLLVGVAIFATPSNLHSIQRWTGFETNQGLELGRFCLLDHCPGNAETFFNARAMRLLKADKPEIKIILSYSDPVPRPRLDGTIVFPGHTDLSIWQLRFPRTGFKKDGLHQS
jgi:hypothetical protein